MNRHLVAFIALAGVSVGMLQIKPVEAMVAAHSVAHPVSHTAPVHTETTHVTTEHTTTEHEIHIDEPHRAIFPSVFVINHSDKHHMSQYEKGYVAGHKQGKKDRKNNTDKHKVPSRVASKLYRKGYVHGYNDARY